jgi:type I restriction enzyme S subunit
MGNPRVSFQDLRDQGTLDFGDGYRAKNAELNGKGPVFLRAAYLQDSGFSLNNPDRFQEADHTVFGAKIARLGDVVLTTKGNSTGRIGVIRDREVGSVYSPHLSYWRSVSPDILDQRFLYFWSRSFDFSQQLHGLAYSTDMAPYLSLRDQARLTIPLPPIGLQRACASILGALDDKIELNRRMNETLEAMARALFKDWFVDFGPTRAKMALRGEAPINQGTGGEAPQKENVAREPYLAPDLWDLFPDRLDADGKPEGWETKPLDEIAEFLNGLALQKFPASDPEDSLPVIKIAELRGGITAKSNRASREVPEKYVVTDGDFLFSWSGSLLAKFWTEGEGALNQHLFKVTSDKYPSWFFSQWVHHHLEEFQAIAASKATTMGHIQRGHLRVCPATLCFFTKPSHHEPD